MACKICRLNPPVQPETYGICQECGLTLGIQPLPPPRRPRVPCTRCQATKFVRVVPREYTVAGGAETAHAIAAPMTLTAEPKVIERWFGGARAGLPSVYEGLGLVETYVCTGCGFVEWYCQDPESLPIGPEYMTDVVDVASASGPYR